MPQEPEGWASVAERLLAGDRAAMLKVSRLVTGYLARWRAYDFRDEWPDLTQDVLMAVVTGLGSGRLQEPEALPGYVRAITRNKLADRLKRRLGHPDAQALAWPPASLSSDNPGEPSPEEVLSLRARLEKLPEKQRIVVMGVYGQGRTYAEVAQETGIPLGTVKLSLREALVSLRDSLGEGPSEAD